MCGFGDWAIAGPHGLVRVVVVERRVVVMYGRTDLNAHATARATQLAFVVCYERVQSRMCTS